MTLHQIDVLAVGNAIVDIFGQCDDIFLAAHKIEIGVMTILDPKYQHASSHIGFPEK